MQKIAISSRRAPRARHGRFTTKAMASARSIHTCLKMPRIIPIQWTSRGAWSRLLALFRLVHRGDRSGWIRRARGQAWLRAHFSLESCRALAARLVWAWERWPEAKPKISQDEDDDLHAKRLVAQRCLYGVDKNPLAMPGVAKLSRGAWYDPAGAEDGAVHVHGNANVLRHDRGTLKLSQARAAAPIWSKQRWKEPLPPVRAFEPPEVVPGITNSPWTGLQLYGHHNPGSVEYF